MSTPLSYERAPVSDTEMLLNGCFRYLEQKDVEALEYVRRIDPENKTGLTSERIVFVAQNNRENVEEALQRLVEDRQQVLPIHTLIAESQASDIRAWNIQIEDAYWPFNMPVRLADFTDRVNRHLHPFYLELFHTRLIPVEQEEREELRRDAMYAFTQRVASALRRFSTHRVSTNNPEEDLRRRARAWIDRAATREMISQEYFLALQRLRWKEHVEAEKREKECLAQLEKEYKILAEEQVKHENEYVRLLMTNHWNEFSDSNSFSTEESAFIYWCHQQGYLKEDMEYMIYRRYKYNGSQREQDRTQYYKARLKILADMHILSQAEILDKRDQERERLEKELREKEKAEMGLADSYGNHRISENGRWRKGTQDTGYWRMGNLVEASNISRQNEIIPQERLPQGLNSYFTEPKEYENNLRKDLQKKKAIERELKVTDAFLEMHCNRTLEHRPTLIGPSGYVLDASAEKRFTRKTPEELREDSLRNLCEPVVSADHTRPLPLLDQEPTSQSGQDRLANLDLRDVTTQGQHVQMVTTSNVGLNHGTRAEWHEGVLQRTQGNWHELIQALSSTPGGRQSSNRWDKVKESVESFVEGLTAQEKRQISFAAYESTQKLIEVYTKLMEKYELERQQQETLLNSIKMEVEERPRSSKRSQDSKIDSKKKSEAHKKNSKVTVKQRKGNDDDPDNDSSSSRSSGSSSTDNSPDNSSTDSSKDSDDSSSDSEDSDTKRKKSQHSKRKRGSDNSRISGFNNNRRDPNGGNSRRHSHNPPTESSPNQDRKKRSKGNDNSRNTDRQSNQSTRARSQNNMTTQGSDSDDDQEHYNRMRYNLCGPYKDLIEKHDREEEEYRRSGRKRKSPDLTRFPLRLENLDLHSIVTFLHRYEDMRGTHPEFLFRMVMFFSDEAKAELAILGAEHNIDVSTYPGGSVTYMEDKDVRKLLHLKVAAKSKDDFRYKLSSIPFDKHGEHTAAEFDAYSIDKLVKYSMLFGMEYRTLAEILAIECPNEALINIDTVDGVLGAKALFLKGFPMAQSGHKTLGQLLYEKSASSDPTLKRQKVFRDWLQGFFGHIAKYREIKQSMDDLNTMILRNDKLPTFAPTKPIRTHDKPKRVDADKTILHHVKFDIEREASDHEDDTSVTPNNDLNFDTSIPDNLAEYVAAMQAEQKPNGCHKKFQFGKCTDTACKLDHSQEGMRRVYLKRLWELAKAHNRPDSDAVMRNIKHALDEIDAQGRAEDKKE